MRGAAVLLFAATLAGELLAQAAPNEKSIREARHRFVLVASKATALFMSADSIERSLNSDGAAIHPQTAALRIRIQSALDEADAAIKERDLEVAATETKLAEELVARLARRIGGE